MDVVDYAGYGFVLVIIIFLVVIVFALNGSKTTKNNPQEKTFLTFVDVATAFVRGYASGSDFKWVPSVDERYTDSNATEWLFVGKLVRGDEEIPVLLQTDPLIDLDSYLDAPISAEVLGRGVIFKLTHSFFGSSVRSDGRSVDTFVKALERRIKFEFSLLRK